MILFEIPKIKEKYSVNRFALVMGAILPDLIDKPLFFLGLTAGRDFGHSLLFVISSFIIVYIMTKKNQVVYLSYLLGLSSHFLLDIPNLPLFFPFISYEYGIPDDPIEAFFQSLFENPLNLATEIIGILILVFIMINNRLYNIRAIHDFLKTKSQIPKIESKIVT